MKKIKFLSFTLYATLITGVGLFFIGSFGASISHAGYFDYDDVVVVVNDTSATSTTIGTYFQTARSIPDSHMIHISTPETETITRSVFDSDIRTPIENYLTSNNLASSTNYIVTTKGVPLRISGTTSTSHASVDQELMLILGSQASLLDGDNFGISAYYNTNTQFSNTSYGNYLATRLTGYTIQQVEDLIDRSTIATTIDSGIFVLDVDTNRDNPTYQNVNDWMRTAGPLLSAKGYSVTLDETTTYLTNQTNVLGYYSWGSNDCCDVNNGIPGNTYVNGAIGETAVSTSARSFAYPPTYGQSLVADWIAEGISGMSGYVYEPYTTALAHADILFDRYTSGYTLADSFGMASYALSWQQVVVGDPKTIIVKRPLPFSLSSPTDNDITSSVSPTFSWSAATSYNTISKYQLFIDGALHTDDIAGISTIPSSDLSSGTHTWHIKAFDTQNATTTSTETHTLNIIPGYSAGSHTFYVNNVAGDDAGPGSQASPYATIGKATALATAGDTITIIKNNNQPYRKTVTPTNAGTSDARIIIQGVDENSKPEIWGSDDVSGGWSAYGGGNPDTFQKTVPTEPKVVAAGSSITNLQNKTLGISQDVLSEGEWFWATSTLYYRPTVSENIATLHIESGARASSISSTAQRYITFKNMNARFANTDCVAISTNVTVHNMELEGCDTGLKMYGANPQAQYIVSHGNTSYGVHLMNASSAKVYNSLFYNNGTSGVHVYTLSGFRNFSTINNTLVAGNGNYSFSLETLLPPLSVFTASHNNWQESGDTDWITYQGTNNQASTSPLFVDTAGKNFRLKQLSPNIDTGTIISGLTTDILGNSVYGTPDIGPYEYQPPYTMSTHTVGTDGSVRIYSDGKYRYTSATSTTNTADITVTPLGGFGTGDYTEYMNIIITDWQTSGTYAKAWTASSTSATTTLYTVGDLKADTYYTLAVDGTDIITAQSDDQGNAIFSYSGGYSSHDFTVEEDTTSPSTVELSSPTNNASTRSVEITFSWQAAQDTESGITQYALYIDNTLTAAIIAGTTSFVTDISCGTHTWYVQTTDLAGNSSTSSTFTLTRVCGGGGGGGSTTSTTPTPSTQPTTTPSVTTPTTIVEEITNTTQLTEGMVIKGEGSEVYLITQGKKRWITSADIFVARGYDWNAIMPVTEAVLLAYPDGSSITVLDVSTQKELRATNDDLYDRLKGIILLKVEDKGKAYYVHPNTHTVYYLGRPADAFFIMREQGIGISNADLEKFPLALSEAFGKDTDGDELSDMLEDAIGTGKFTHDTDDDGFSDSEELLQGFSPTSDKKLFYDISFANRHKGKIFLQVENHGEAWFINPADRKRYFLGRPEDAFALMRNLSLGISNRDFDTLIQQ